MKYYLCKIASAKNNSYSRTHANYHFYCDYLDIMQSMSAKSEAKIFIIHNTFSKKTQVAKNLKVKIFFFIK